MSEMLDLAETELRRRFVHDEQVLARHIFHRPHWKHGVNFPCGYFWVRSGDLLLRLPLPKPVDSAKDVVSLVA